jgi:hypothetical protein
MSAGSEQLIKFWLLERHRMLYSRTAGIGVLYVIFGIVLKNTVHWVGSISQSNQVILQEASHV